MPLPPELRRLAVTGTRLWLFLDYDGTLVPLARTPGEAQPDPPLLDLLTCLVNTPSLRVTILSGRPLSWLQAVLSIPGLMLAGTYGVETQLGDGTLVVRADDAQMGSRVQQIKGIWTELVKGHEGFFIEDKGRAVALHARFAQPEDADVILPAAESAARQLMTDTVLRVVGGHRFLEIAPAAAHKGATVEWLLQEQSFPNAQLVYFGDDDKDEQAFEVIVQHGGLPIVVGEPRGPTLAPIRASSPSQVREWLAELGDALAL